jgi:hypothetical protein
VTATRLVVYQRLSLACPKTQIAAISRHVQVVPRLLRRILRIAGELAQTPRAPDAQSRLGACLKSSKRDLSTAVDADPVPAKFHPRQGSVNLFQVRVGLLEQCLRLGSLKRQRGALWIMLVVGGGVATSGEKCTHLLGETLDLESGLLPVSSEVIPQ